MAHPLGDFDLPGGRYFETFEGAEALAPSLYDFNLSERVNPKRSLPMFVLLLHGLVSARTIPQVRILHKEQVAEVAHRKVARLDSGNRHINLII